MKRLLLSRTILDAPFVYDVLKHHLTSSDTVLVILYSFFERFLPTQKEYDDLYAPEGAYDLKMRRQLELYGANIEYLNYYHDDAKTRTEKINRATVLFFPGGAPDEMLERLKAHKLIEGLKNFKGMIIGSSAGAMIQATRTHIYKDQEYSKFSFFEGLGYVNGFDFTVHYKRRIQQKKAIKKVFRTYPQNIYSIPDDGALFVENGHVMCLGSARQLYNEKGVIK